MRLDIYLISPDSLRFCPDTDNPADIPTRGTAASGLEHNELSWNGPRLFKTSEENWPENADLQKVTPEAMEELKSSDLTVINLSVTSDVNLLKTAIFPISVFLLLFSMKFHTELEIISMTVFNKGDSYLSLSITAHAQNKQFL